MTGTDRAVGLDRADQERPEIRRRIDVAATFDEIGGGTVVAHRLGRGQIVQFLADEVKPPIHVSACTRVGVCNYRLR